MAMVGAALVALEARSMADIVGRGAERRALRECLATARADGAVLALVSGGPGLGKSSLLRAAQRELEDTGATVLWACGQDRIEDYGTVGELFASADLSAAVAPVGAWTPTRSADSEMDEFFALAVGLMSSGPLVVLLDDAPCCDAASLRWLDFLLRRSTRLPLLVVLASRPHAGGAGSALVAEIGTAHRVVTLDLAPLACTELADIVRRVLGREPATSFVRLCVELSGGNPALLWRLVERLHAEGVAPEASATREGAIVGREVLAVWVRDYLAGQPEYVRQVATVVSVLGADVVDTVGGKAVGGLCGVSESLVAASLEVLRRDDVLVTAETGLRHSEIRRAILADAPPERLNSLRLRAAVLLEVSGGPVDRVARLLMALPDASIPWMRHTLRRAAAATAATGSARTAAAYLDRVLRATPDDVEVLAELAAALAEYDPATAQERLTAAIAGAPEARVRARLACRLGAVALAGGRGPQAFPLIETVLDELDALTAAEPDSDPDDVELRSTLWSTLAAVALSRESTTAGVLARGRISAQEGDSLVVRAERGWAAYLTMLAGRDVPLVIAQAQFGLVQGPALHYWPMGASAVALRCAGESDAALAGLGRILAAAPRDDDAPLRRMALTARASVLEEVGELTAAAADARAAMLGGWRDHALQEAVAPEIRLASVLVKMRAPGDALALLDRVRRPHFGWLYPAVAMTRAEAYRQRGDLGGAVVILRTCGQALERAGVRNPVFAPWWLDAACVLMELGHRGEARDLADYGEDVVRDWQTPESRGLALLTRGVVTPGPAGLEHLDAAVDAFAASPALLSHARAEYLLGKALVEAERTGAARTHLRRAVELAVRCDYLTLAVVARELLVVAGGRMPELSGRRADTLSGTEARIARLAAAGATNREIAEGLFVSVRTVETHLSTIYRKLKVRLRTELPVVLRVGVDDGQAR
jgi:DNA-binding CsgD family transcriptional regulator